eukprot:TRINITY_DN7005_c0_g1_i8.p1 TRINITY_DN7005_c0_g1~~TRINITY_DN7005_c0_g1_i8.p1  ORF type:complete len:242 (+),score=47.87 TRINITY_DN7005_c0_g1_i8:136-861(+)
MAASLAAASGNGPLPLRALKATAPPTTLQQLLNAAPAKLDDAPPGCRQGDPLVARGGHHERPWTQEETRDKLGCDAKRHGDKLQAGAAVVCLAPGAGRSRQPSRLNAAEGVRYEVLVPHYMVTEPVDLEPEEPRTPPSTPTTHMPKVVMPLSVPAVWTQMAATPSPYSAHQASAAWAWGHPPPQVVQPVALRHGPQPVKMRQQVFQEPIVQLPNLLRPVVPPAYAVPVKDLDMHQLRQICP